MYLTDSDVEDSRRAILRVDDELRRLTAGDKRGEGTGSRRGDAETRAGRNGAATAVSSATSSCESTLQVVG